MRKTKLQTNFIILIFGHFQFVFIVCDTIIDILLFLPYLRTQKYFTHGIIPGVQTPFHITNINI